MGIIKSNKTSFILRINILYLFVIRNLISKTLILMIITVIIVRVLCHFFIVKRNALLIKNEFLSNFAPGFFLLVDKKKNLMLY